MSILLLAVTSFAAISGAFLVQPLHFSEVVRNFTSIETIAVRGPGHLHVPVKRKLHGNPNQKRQSYDGLGNDISGYSIEIGIGTPPQNVELQIDTGSSELWVNPTCSNAWNPSGCILNGFYYPSSSSTKAVSSNTFKITYGLGSASGFYVEDNILMGGVKIVAQQFGDALNTTDMMEGIIGVGWGYGLDTSYYNIIDQLAAQGITHSRAFSLDLASIDVAQGSIIFGGIDTMKYTGALEKRSIMPYYQAPDHYPRYWIYMTSLGVTTPESGVSKPVTTSSINQAIFPDSGSTFCYLPPALFAGLLSFFPTAVNRGSSQYTVPCSLKNQNGTIDFGFGGTTIHVSYHEFVWFDGAQCWLAAVPSTQFFLLGDSFIRSAYIVYDQGNANVLLAQAANCGTNIIPITSGINAVPSVIGGCTPPKSTTSSFPTSSSRSSSSSSSIRTSTSSKSSFISTSVPSSSSRSTTAPLSKSSSKLQSSSSSVKLATTTTSSKAISTARRSISSLKITTSSSSMQLRSMSSVNPPILGCLATATVTVTTNFTSVSTKQAHGTCTAVGQAF